MSERLFWSFAVWDLLLAQRRHRTKYCPVKMPEFEREIRTKRPKL